MEVYNNAHYDDFIGFTFNGKHSSEFGLLRVSDGDRYEDNFVPSLNDETTDVPGGPGQYYYGETIKERNFLLSMAYDNIGEKDKRRIKHWLHPDDELHELIFDEKPYIKYWVKCSKEVITNELCFNESYITGTDSFEKPIYSERRVYKGDFKIEFTAYMPYGIEVNKNLDEFNPKNSVATIPKDNFSEWADSSGLLSLTKYNLDNFNSNQANIYNGGDIETGFELTFNMAGKTTTFTPLNKEKETDIYGINGVVGNKLTTLNNNYVYCIADDEGNILISELNDPGGRTLDNIMFYYRTESGEKIEGMNGKIVTINEHYSIPNDTTPRSVFESATNGQIYDLYIYGLVPKDKLFYYKISNTTSIWDKTYWFKMITTTTITSNGKPFKVFGVRNNSDYAYAYGYLLKDSSGNIYTRITMPGYIGMNHEFTVNSITTSICDFVLQDSNNKTLNSFRFKVPGISTANTKYWSEAQKAISAGGQFKIDTNKKTVSYRQNTNSDWIGLNGVISEGNLFKLPSDLDKYFDGITSAKLNKLKIKHSNPQSMGNISNVTLSYKYLYI